MGAMEELLAEAESVFGPRTVGDDPSSIRMYSVSGTPPVAVIKPTDSGPIGDFMKAADKSRAKIVVAGSGSGLNTGFPPEGEYAVLSTSSLGRIKDLDPYNFTVAVETGAGLSGLRADIFEAGRLLSLDSIYGGATLGGAVCSNSNGPLRLFYGGLRDILLGAKVILPDGRRGSFGGKVVKNVAGYDISKLLIGSGGTLGFIEEVILKLFPLPEREATYTALFPDPDSSFSAADALRTSQLLPARIVLLDHNAAIKADPTGLIPKKEGEFTLLVSYHGFGEVVRRQFDETAVICSSLSARDAITLTDDGELWSGMNNAHRSGGGDSTYVFKMGFPCANLCKAYGEVSPLTRLRSEGAVIVDAGCGLMYVFLHEVDDQTEIDHPIQGLKDRLAFVAEANGGYLSVENAPSPLKNFHQGGDRVASHRIMEQVRRKFDPHGILCPERFPWLLKD